MPLPETNRGQRKIQPRGKLAGPPGMGLRGGVPALPVQPFGTVEQEIERELELELPVAASTGPGKVTFRRRHGDGQDVRTVPTMPSGNSSLSATCL